MRKSSALCQIATERRRIARDNSDILGRLIEERYDWLPADVAAGLRRRHLAVFVSAWKRAGSEVRATLARRHADRSTTIEAAIADAARGYWLLARIAGAGIRKYTGIGTPNNPVSDLRRWLYRDRVVSIARR